jgi:hypothetical protein
MRTGQLCAFTRTIFKRRHHATTLEDTKITTILRTMVAEK